MSLANWFSEFWPTPCPPHPPSRPGLTCRPVQSGLGRDWRGAGASREASPPLGFPSAYIRGRWYPTGRKRPPREFSGTAEEEAGQRPRKAWWGSVTTPSSGLFIPFLWHVGLLVPSSRIRNLIHHGVCILPFLEPARSHGTGHRGNTEQGPRQPPWGLCVRSPGAFTVTACRYPVLPVSGWGARGSERLRQCRAGM